jgi:membrane-bound metal-dependent hydrolase YbcI (DUF457 family)
VPLPVAHGLLGASVVAALHPETGTRRARRYVLAGAVLANCADLDFLLVFAFHTRAWHRAFAHSLFFGLLVTLALVLALGLSRLREASALGLAYISHGLLDWATTKEGGGVELLWPFSGERLMLAWRGLSEIPSRLPPAEIMRDLLLELLIFAPPLLLIIFLRRRRAAS